MGARDLPYNAKQMSHEPSKGVTDRGKPERAGPKKLRRVLGRSGRGVELAGPCCGNRGIPLNLEWLSRVRVNTSAVERERKLKLRVEP